MQVVREAQRIAEALRRPSLSRQHFGRIRGGRATASEDKIYIIVAAMRSVTGILFRACDLFELDPLRAEGVLPGIPSLHRMPACQMDSSNAYVPVFSDHRVSRVRRLFVVQEPGSTEQAFESLYTEYGLLLRTIAIRQFHVPSDDAEALVHDIFASYLERRAYVRDVKGWLTGAIRNACNNYLRKRKPESPLLPEHEDKADGATEARLERWMQRTTIVSILSRLGERCRETLRRYYLREESKETIAADLATSPGNVLQLLVTCRKRAQELLRRLTGKGE